MFCSFIVPVYNVEKYLPECLDSLLEQDIPHEDYEIICVNDGSTDGSLSILRDYEARCSNVRVIDKENGGVSTARNTGLDAARGDYIWFVDSDDLIAPRCLKLLREHTRNSQMERIRFGTYLFDGKLTASEKQAIADKTITANSRFYDSSIWNSI